MSLIGSPPVSSPMTARVGLPMRPSSAITTPRTWTVVPIGFVRASAMVATTSGGSEGDAVGVGVGMDVGVGVGDATGVGVGSGGSEGVGVGPVGGEGVGVGLGGGVAGALATNSPGRVAYTRYPSVPVPLL